MKSPDDPEAASGRRELHDTRRPQGLTMRDVAESAGVSTMTVSRVLNGRSGVSHETAASVRAAAAAIGYRKNELARSLRPGQRSRLIALVIGDISNPFYGFMAQAVEQLARAAGYAVVIMNTNEDPAIERAGINDLLARRVDGLILVSCDSDHRYLRVDIDNGLAVVFADRPPMNLEADTVLANDRQSAFDATVELARRGHQRIGFLGDYPHVYTARERHAGYQDAMKSVGQQERFVEQGAHTRGEAKAVVAGWLTTEQPPTAIVAVNNLLASGASAAIRASSTHVELVGFDSLPDSDVEHTVGRNVADFGSRAGELLFEQLEGVARQPVTEVLDLEFHDSTLLDADRQSAKPIQAVAT